MIKITHIESLIENHETSVGTNSKGDKRNIFVLLVLYTLQGVPLGLSLAIPIIIQTMHRSSFKEQAKFSLAVWPFSLKLLWAPLVDSLFIRKWGRRKSWLIPVQYFLGLFFFITGFYVNEWIDNESHLNINALTLVFFILNFLAATQDIIVDGWALTMLHRRNISYASICNGAGQAFGIFLGYNLTILLISGSFWNIFGRTSSPGGVITLQGYFYFWGIIYIVVTTLVAIFKHEKDYLTELDGIYLSIVKTYMLLFSIMKLPNIKMFAIILLTNKVCFCAVDATFKLKLIDSGITKDEIAGIDLLTIPLKIGLPFYIANFTSKEKPLKNYFNIIPYRLLLGVVLTIVVYFTPYFLVQPGPLLLTYKVFLVPMVYSLQQLMVSIMTLTSISFYASISDPKIGGTNMTLLNTISNLGNALSKTGALWLIELLTFKRCSNDLRKVCSSKKNYEETSCSPGGTCQVFIDGFYIETIMCTIYGIIWIIIFKKIINNLQSKHVKEWHVEMKTKEIL